MLMPHHRRINTCLFRYSVALYFYNALRPYASGPNEIAVFENIAVCLEGIGEVVNASAMYTQAISLSRTPSIHSLNGACRTSKWLVCMPPCI